MKLRFLIIFLCGFLVGHSQPDIILYNGKIFTSNKAALWAEAIAIKGERISAVGKNEVVLKSKGAQTRLIDLQDHVVVPGFNDAHAHVGPPYPGRAINLWREPSQPTPWKTVRDSVSKVISEIPPGTWITSVVNPDLFADKRADRLALHSIAPEHPVVLSSWTGHGKLMNTHALTLTGLTDESVSPGGWLRKMTTAG